MKTCIKCGSHAFNLYAEGIDQGGFCDVHYWQGRAHRAEAQPEQKTEGKQFQTKFNLEDRVWYMKNNKPTEVIISAVEIFFVNTNQDRITYNAKHVDHSVSWLDHTKLQEEWLFKSKIELLESL